MSQGIEGKAALVTGGGSGIGLAVAEKLAADGAHVTICGRTEDKLVEAVATVEKSVGQGGSIRYAVADVTVEDQVAAAVATASEPTGSLDILVANAGGSMHIGPMDAADIDAVRSTIELNLLGTIVCTKHAIGAMKEAGGGSIIAISSGAGHFPHKWLWAYGAAKAGIDQFCQYAAEELGYLGIRVNSIQPGIVANELMSMITAGGPLMDDYLANMPVSRAGEVTDIAEAVRYLAGPESAWVTGVALPVDGGHHLRKGADYSLLFGGAPG